MSNLLTKVKRFFTGKKQRTVSFHKTFSELDKNGLSDGHHVPHVLRECIEFLRQADHIKRKFILKEPGRARLVDKVYKRINAGMPANFNAIGDVDVASDILKQFLAAMPSFLISHDIYWHVTEYKFSMLTEFRKKAVLMHAIHQTAPINRTNLCFLMDFLQQVNDEPENQMSAGDLALIFAPIVIKPEGRETIEFRLEAVKIMTFFIENYDEIISTVLGFESIGNIEMLKIHGSVLFYV